MSSHPAHASGRDSPPPSEQNPNQGRQAPSVGKFSDSVAQKTRSRESAEDVSEQKGGIGKVDSQQQQSKGGQKPEAGILDKLESNPKGPLDQYVEGKTKTSGL